MVCDEAGRRRCRRSMIAGVSHDDGVYTEPAAVASWLDHSADLMQGGHVAVEKGLAGLGSRWEAAAPDHQGRSCLSPAGTDPGAGPPVNNPSSMLWGLLEAVIRQAKRATTSRTALI